MLLVAFLLSTLSARIMIAGLLNIPQPELIEVNSVIDYEGEELEISQELEDLIIKTFGV